MNFEIIFQLTALLFVFAAGPLIIILLSLQSDSGL